MFIVWWTSEICRCCSFGSNFCNSHLPTLALAVCIMYAFIERSLSIHLLFAVHASFRVFLFFLYGTPNYKDRSLCVHELLFKLPLHFCSVTKFSVKTWIHHSLALIGVGVSPIWDGLVQIGIGGSYVARSKIGILQVFFHVIPQHEVCFVRFV